jgi:hypothetical protein
MYIVPTEAQDPRYLQYIEIATEDEHAIVILADKRHLYCRTTGVQDDRRTYRSFLHAGFVYSTYCYYMYVPHRTRPARRTNS